MGNRRRIERVYQRVYRARVWGVYIGHEHLTGVSDMYPICICHISVIYLARSICTGPAARQYRIPAMRERHRARDAEPVSPVRPGGQPVAPGHGHQPACLHASPRRAACVSRLCLAPDQLAAPGLSSLSRTPGALPPRDRPACSLRVACLSAGLHRMRGRLAAHAGVACTRPVLGLCFPPGLPDLHAGPACATYQAMVCRKPCARLCVGA